MEWSTPTVSSPAIIQKFEHLTKLDDATLANGALENFATDADGESLFA
jgi:hypothetical protein